MACAALVFDDPDILIAIGNGWWTEGTSIVAIQEATVETWARLFGVPIVTAFNLWLSET